MLPALTQSAAVWLVLILLMLLKLLACIEPHHRARILPCLLCLTSLHVDATPFCWALGLTGQGPAASSFLEAGRDLSYDRM